jgi:hypothetical protein
MEEEKNIRKRRGEKGKKAHTIKKEKHRITDNL